MEVKKVGNVASGGKGLVHEVGVGEIGGGVFHGGGGGGGGDGVGGQQQEGKDVGILLYQEVMEEDDQEQVGNMSLEVEKIGGGDVVHGRAEEMELGGGGACEVLRHVDGDENGGSMEDMVMWRGKIEVCAEGGHVVVGSLEDGVSRGGEGFKLQEVDQDVMEDKNGERRRREVMEHGRDLQTDMVRFTDEKQQDDGVDRQQIEGEAETTTISPSVIKGRGKTPRDTVVEWSDGATIVLLNAFSEKYRALERSNFTSKIWADIAACVNARRVPLGAKGTTSGASQGEDTPKTQEQCRIKVDNLKKRYKVEREKMLTSGMTTSKWPFFDALDDLVGSKPRNTRAGGGTGGSLRLGLANGQPLALRSSGEEGDRIFYLEARNGLNVDHKPDTFYNFTPLSGRGKRKKALEDLEREHVIAASLRALFEGFNIAGNIIDAMAHEEVDEDTLLNSRDVGSLLEKILAKHQLAIKLGPAERIKQAIEEAKERKLRAAQ
ncbi:hypothetical protein BDL97_07G097300 [Sphagnum fallax]|nr:hypothetical protein BDL97_07G097300 [Sphagnum fallax]KAH8957547.1 hypothetical protein BDL97_07G097300 [Sphagnum fallax]KAH8957548.1 hypothetical protein BDL97_07G097300 [Sphagnum fallax]KAH8957549.1 hypothetical protein BDL97_07G097300 [Sphagnum fallax]